MTAQDNKGGRVLALAEPQQPPSRRDESRSLALAELSGTLAEVITDTDVVVDRVVELVSRFLGDTAVLLLLDGEGTGMRVGAAYDVDPHRCAVISDALASMPADIDVLGPYRVVVRESCPLLLDGDRFDTATSMMEPEARRALQRLGVHAALICPLRVRGEVIGTLGLWRHRNAGPHSERDQSFAQELADRAALAIENARLVERLHAEVEERKRSEESLRLTSELLQRGDDKRKALIEHLVAAQEEERRRIAIDVHDDSIQAMAAIGLRLQILRRHASNHEFAERISEIEDAVMESIARLRNLLIRLESTSLEKEGLARAIGRCIDDLFPDLPPRERVLSRLRIEPPGYVRVVLFRVAQEAITNVRKHARASDFSVILSEENEGTLLTIQDNGLGFDPKDVADHSLPGHLGMQAMRQRAQVAGGWLDVDSKRSKGTTIRCWLPTINTLSQVAE